MSIYGTSCCGLKDYEGLQDTRLEDIFEEIYRYSLHNRFRFIMFTGTRRFSKKFDKVVKFIDDNKLGAVTVTDWARNPNSGNRVKVAVWTLDIKKLKAWGAKNVYGY